MRPHRTATRAPTPADCRALTRTAACRSPRHRREAGAAMHTTAPCAPCRPARLPCSAGVRRGRRAPLRPHSGATRRPSPPRRKSRTPQRSAIRIRSRPDGTQAHRPRSLARRYVPSLRDKWECRTSTRLSALRRFAATYDWSFRRTPACDRDTTPSGRRQSGRRSTGRRSDASRAGCAPVRRHRERHRCARRSSAAARGSDLSGSRVGLQSSYQICENGISRKTRQFPCRTDWAPRLHERFEQARPPVQFVNSAARVDQKRYVHPPPVQQVRSTQMNHAEMQFLTTEFPYKKQYANFIGGEWVKPVGGEYFDNVSPITGEPFTSIPRSREADVELALDAAHRAKAAWGKTSTTDRANILNRIADRMEANLQRIAVAETIDNGKPLRETMAADIPLAIDHFRYFAGCARAQEGSISQIDEDTVAYHFHEPLGVVGQIIPWNFPILMAVWKLAPALAAGNC